LLKIPSPGTVAGWARRAVGYKELNLA